jgi:hypothetical protein
VAVGSGGGTVDCASLDSILLNPSFEDPFVDGFGYVTDVYGWETTDVLGEMELWGEAMGIPLLDGLQFAELNVNSAGEIYQDMPTVPG